VIRSPKWFPDLERFIQHAESRLQDIGVIIAAAIMWRSPSSHRFYADPAISMIISVIIFSGAIPLSASDSMPLFLVVWERFRPRVSAAARKSSIRVGFFLRRLPGM